MCSYFTIGCDPELIMAKNGRIIPADSYLEFKSSFGTDGCDAVTELRPGYDSNPIALTAKIKKILDYGAGQIPADVGLYSGHFQYDYPIGGHIHIGMSMESRFIIMNMNIALEALSNCIDDIAQRDERRSSGYGQIGDYRENNWGFEYRTPGSWLLSPATTLSYLTMAKLAVLAYTEQKDRLKPVVSLDTIHSIYGDKKLLENIGTIYEDTLKIPIPDDCVKGIKVIQELIKVKINWNDNIRSYWRLV